MYVHTENPKVPEAGPRIHKVHMKPSQLPMRAKSLRSFTYPSMYNLSVATHQLNPPTRSKNARPALLELDITSHPPSRVRRHVHPTPLAKPRILLPPQTRHRLHLREEGQARLPIKRAGAGAGDALFVAGEGEHGQGHGDGHVDADLAGLDGLGEMRRRGARAGEDGGAVAVLVGVYERDGCVEAGGGEADEDGTEDFLLVAFHVRLDFADDGRTDLHDNQHRGL